MEIAVRDVDTAYREMVSKYHAMAAGEAEIAYLTARWRALPGDQQNAGFALDELLSAQERLAQAEFDFATAEAGYNVALIGLCCATGTMVNRRTLTRSSSKNPAPMPTLSPSSISPRISGRSCDLRTGSQKVLEAIHTAAGDLRHLDDASLRSAADELRASARSGADIAQDEILVPAFALVLESTAPRAWHRAFRHATSGRHGHGPRHDCRDGDGGREDAGGRTAGDALFAPRPRRPRGDAERLPGPARF